MFLQDSTRNNEGLALQSSEVIASPSQPVMRHKFHLTLTSKIRQVIGTQAWCIKQVVLGVPFAQFPQSFLEGTVIRILRGGGVRMAQESATLLTGPLTP
jgi:hypothetical protein